jgi:hypothetical protein
LPGVIELETWNALSSRCDGRLRKLAQLAAIDKRFQDVLLEGDWPYLWIEATYVKVRQNGRIGSVAVTVAVGVNSDGAFTQLAIVLLRARQAASANGRCLTRGCWRPEIDHWPLPSQKLHC